MTQQPGSDGSGYKRRVEAVMGTSMGSLMGMSGLILMPHNESLWYVLNLPDCLLCLALPHHHNKYGSWTIYQAIYVQMNKRGKEGIHPVDDYCSSMYASIRR